ncbi:hypothetical protein [Kribbella shirazensis]|uniref:Uncharacterized protein n=1 Tax=Kribbella shirazensis TaxID=1105143 RepID=A0A7X5VKX0_9ACTN|nr:hypothetical protein [Kribbella shirazensis]NIK61973.1 hypothetical protein [Kribbella shirazensis]
MDDLMVNVDRLFAAQLSADVPPGAAAPVQVPAGIVSYQAVRTGTDTLLTITAFRSAELLERAQQGAAAIRESLADFEVEEIETFSGEVAISRVSEDLLTPVRPRT